MATQALILVNGVAGSNDNLPINTLINLANNNLGGEVTWAWTILDQPPGAADALSSTNTSATTLTPKKEGTYLLRIDVNAGLPDEAINQVVIAVRDLKTFERVPAAGETAEDSSVTGWALAVDSILKRSLGLAADPGVVVAVAGQALSLGQVVSFLSAQTIKTGLPGQEYLPTATLAAANNAASVASSCGVFLSRVSDGSTTCNLGDIVRIRVAGLGGPFNGTSAAGTPLFVGNDSSLSANTGTIERRIGTVLLSVNGGTQFYALLDGLGMLSARAVNDLVAVSLSIAGALTAGATGVSALGPILAALISFTASGPQQLFKSQGPLQLGTSDPNEVDFFANGVKAWALLASGVLQAQGQNRAIQSVLDPVNAQDAATKNYVDGGYAGQKVFTQAASAVNSNSSTPVTAASVTLTVPAGYLADVALIGDVAWSGSVANLGIAVGAYQGASLIRLLETDTASETTVQSAGGSTAVNGLAAGTYTFNLKIFLAQGIGTVSTSPLNGGNLTAIMMLRKT